MVNHEMKVTTTQTTISTIMMKLTMSNDAEVDNPSNNIHDDGAFAPLKLVDHDC